MASSGWASDANVSLRSEARHQPLEVLVQTLKQVDVVIVGSGWSGMIMAKEIATRTALKVLVLERGGPARDPAAYAEEMDEVDTFLRMRRAESAANGLATTRASSRDRAAPIRQY